MRPDAALSGPKAKSVALNGTLRLPRAACLPISVEGLVRLRSWRRCASIIRRYLRVTTQDQESILDGHRRCGVWFCFARESGATFASRFRKAMRRNMVRLLARPTSVQRLCVTLEHWAIAP